MPKILVDTCVWSEVLRRKNPSPIIQEQLSKMLLEGQAIVIGPIRQEILSGISDKEKFINLKTRLAVLPDIPIITEDYELAAEYSNICRRNGVQGSAVDFLICAVAVRNEFVIYTVDKDYEQYKAFLPIMLWI